MKKILYFLIISFFTMNIVYAFDIDINKIDINSKSKELVEELNKTYNIEVNGFDKKIIVNEDINKFVKEVTSLSLSNINFDQKFNEFSKKYLFINQNNGANTLSGSLFAKSFLSEISNKKIKANNIKDIKTVLFNEDDVLAFVYLNDASVEDKEQDLILVYWLKKSNNAYKVYMPYLTYADDLEEHFNKVAKNEETSYIGTTYNKISLTNEEVIKVDNSLLDNIYNQNKYSSVQITGMSNTGIDVYSSGFVVRKGIIATTWSSFLKYLTDSDYIYVSDCDGKTYDVLGVVAAQIDYDIVLLKINEEALSEVTIGNSSNLKIDDQLFMINSKANGNFSINYGSFVSLDKGRLKNLFALASSDVGSALYDKDGKAVAFTVGDSINANLSFANDLTYLKKLQNILINQSFANISYVSLKDFKSNYYRNVNGEITYTNLENSSEFQKVGDVLNNIDLPLLKASFKDNILSLRYKNDVGKMLNSLYLIDTYTECLEKDGYKKIYEKDNKLIYQNNKYKVIIKNNLNYLIILIMEK